MEEKTFVRTKEDFVCGHCDLVVKGDGYTNHCPQCLWSKHVDITPGDRKEMCGGLMEPIESEYKKGKWSVIQKCQRCSRIWKNEIRDEDDFNVVIHISKDDH